MNADDTKLKHEGMGSSLYAGVQRPIGESGTLTDLEGIYLKMVEEAPVGIYIVQDGQIIFGNWWLREFSGYSLADLPMSALTVIAPEDRAFVADQMTRRMQGSDAAPSYSIRYLKRDGTVTWVQLIARRVIFRGRPAIQGSIVDISDKVAAERKLKEYAARLEQNQQIRALIDEVLNHDLVNRIWVMEHSVTGLLETPLTERQQKLIGSLKSSVARAMKTLRNANTYLRLSEAKGFRRSKLSLGAILKRVIQDFDPVAREKDIRVELSDTRILFVGSPLLREVFSNLLGNALKYSPQGSTVSIDARDGETLAIRFRDQGPGIPDGFKERIFQRFERLHPGSARGAGLGLALVKRLVDLHGGKVWVEDNPGGGSIFIVELPRRHQEFAAE